MVVTTGNSLDMPSLPRLVFFVINLAIFYLWLLPTLGDDIARKCHDTWSCRRFLHTTWYGYEVDLADGQWRELRGSMWLLWICLLACAGVHFGLYVVFHHRNDKTEQQVHDTVVKSGHVVRSNGKDGPLHDHYLTMQRLFRLVFALGVLFVQHGYHAFLVIFLATIAFLLVNVTRGTRYCVPFTWSFAIALLFFKESYRLRRYGYTFLDPLFDKSTYGGLYDWQFPANFLILRLISFCIDYHEASTRKHDLKDDKDHDHDHDPSTNTTTNSPTLTTLTPPSSTNPRMTSDATATLTSLHLSEYSYLNFLTYTLYAPLYLAGPIIAFNDFIRSSREVTYVQILSIYPVVIPYQHTLQTHSINPPSHPLYPPPPPETPPPLVTPPPLSYYPYQVEHQKRVPWVYGLRWVACLVLLEYLTHRFPFFAVINSGLFSQLTVFEMAAAAYITLKLMWIKFLLIWRFFRLWALADGIEPPENMLRCMSNNHSLEQVTTPLVVEINMYYP